VRPIEEQTILVTGSSDGLGRFVSRELAARGASVLVHGRNAEKTSAVASEVGGRAVVADLSSLDQVRALADEVGELDTLVNNAGVYVPERSLSADGFELTFAVNYLAHFLLTALLLPRGPARIVNVSSIGQARIDWDNVMLDRGYEPFRAYAQSKLAQTMHTFELAERLDPGGATTVNALHPATLMDTKMVRGNLGRAVSTVEEGAEAVLRLVCDPGLNGATGRFYDGMTEARAHDQAYDPEARRRLWELSEEWTGLSTG
jgi:NAD(P)-dependent dehydrogenase (short-subunit alcohol dehydrogenase family)